MEKINCKGLLCPKPVIEMKKYFDSIENGSAIVIVDNEIANINILRFAEGAGYEAVSEEINGDFNITIEKNKIVEKKEEIDGFSIVIMTDKLGEGSDDLGKTLMKSYLYALSESDKYPEELIFLNGGVKLSTEGSNVIDSIKEIESKGTKIISCGACLDFYNLKDKLLVGEIGNMYTIVDIMNSKRVIKL